VGHPTVIGGSRLVGAHGWGLGYRAPSVARDRLGDRSRPRGGPHRRWSRAREGAGCPRVQAALGPLWRTWR